MTTNNKRTKFVTLANSRVNNALKAINLIGNLSSRTSYDYSPADVTKIVGALTKELDHLQERFSTKKIEKAEFSLE